MKYFSLIILLAACAPQTKSGATGAQGQAGTPGTEITPIKFCKESAVYPVVFPEYGLCINNQVYGVYSANGGFLALLPSGEYLSAGVGSACNFTIGSNCSVKQH